MNTSNDADRTTETAKLLPYGDLAEEIAALLQRDDIVIPQRLVMPLASGGSFFIMPATDGEVAISKVITFTPTNPASGRPTIMGDVLVFEVATGERTLILDGPSVTARRTAAVSLLAAQRLAPNPAGPLLIVGAGVQGRAHLEAFVSELPLTEVWITSRTRTSAERLRDYARTLGVSAEICEDPDQALPDCPLVVTVTPADKIVIHGTPRKDAFIAAVGAFTAKMAELSIETCRWIATHGTIVLDSPDAVHEAGDLLQAGLETNQYPTLQDVMRTPDHPRTGPVLFKSCGWAGWDLAAARLAHRLNRS
ncbi:delta(1)-pyrroline-2-carboxylate reductase family protein [Tepidiphilus olei]|uniref:delta(1)-pyrroline-2-carboxylate reductase family protein n=1 Tax=Tepidiphilus olei TaxID=2502184 RepID=UPI00115D3402|nr:delta(1)-pyrroline-2-carboxylate reductase family protein [Tepidiphilus olei]